MTEYHSPVLDSRFAIDPQGDPMRAPAAPRRVRALAIALVVASALPAGSTHAQVAGQNINMVSGTKWPGGDPFLQRQNEPSLAVSSRNPLHLLAGANDYRTVDLPTDPGSIPGTLSGDAWLGVFKSFNGGLTWQSTLHPGFPQDKSAGSAGLNSPLKAYSAAADPTVRAGAAGLFFYSGIAFNRGTNIGAVFVSRFYDLNNKENGDATDPSQSKDPIAFVDTRLIDTGTSGQFIDKPWIAVDQPRGTTTCSIPVGGGVNIPAGNVYLAWSRFTGSSSTKIMFSRSTDCGKTWSTPTKLSESNSINQGTNVAIDPQTGNVFVVWRRFATSSQPDAILCAKSTDFGNSFASKNTSTIVNLGTGTAPNLWAFDQGSSEAQFRTNALPSMAVSVDFSVSPALSRVHAAFAARPSATGDARIYVSTSTDGLTWSTPTAADGLGITDDFGVTLTRGHQFMPQLTFSQGRLMLLYYDQRLDHTLGIAYPTLGFPDPATGKFYLFKRDPRGELLTNPNAVYTFTIADATPPLSVRRHTIDLRVASRRPSDAGFTATAVTQYKYGLRVDSLGDFVDETGAPAGSRALPPPLTQIQTNPPNLPLFAQGTIPFLGDYVDIAGPAFVSDGAGHWIFNTAPVAAPIFYATWTDNRDVIPPADGDWTHYTPVGGGGASVTDGQTITPTCASGQAGMRNQNIYVSRVSDGLIVNSLQNIKPLSPNQTRAFVVTMQNLTAQDRTFRMTLAPGPGVTASFLQGSALSSLDVTIGARLGAARPVFATSATVAGTIIVNVIEVTGPGGVVTPNPLQGAVVLNPEGSAAQLAQPDNAPPLSNGEIYTPSLSLINILNTNPFINILNANQNINILNPTTGAVTVSNPDPALINILNTDGSNADVSNASTSAINILNQDPAVINILNINILNSSTANTGISNINILNQTIGSINILNQTVGSINILNTPLSDATYRVTNAGNTAHSYRIALYGSNSNNVPLQVITTKTYSSPTASGCTLVQQNQNVRYSDVQNPLVATNLADATLPDIADSGIQNPTLSLAPGESAFVTLRGETDAAGMAQLVQQLTPVITAHGNPTGGNQFALLLFIQTTSGSLPVAVVGVPYNNGSGFAFQSAGGSGNVTWTPGGTLPTGLTLSPGGLLSGTPSAAGSFTFSVTATDSSPIPETTTQTISMTVMPRMTSTALTLSKNPVAVNEAVSATVTVSDIQVGGTKSFPSGTVTVGSGAVSGSCTLAPTATAGVATCAASLAAGASGSYPLTAAFPGTSIHAASSSSPAVLLAVNLRSTTTAVVLSPNPTTVLAPTTVTATVTDVSAGTPSSPAGLVTFSSSVPGDAFSPASCPPAPTTSTTSSCAVTLTPATNAARTVTASYGGSAVHAPSASGANLVVNAPLYTFLGFSSPLTTAGSLSAPSFSGSQNLGSAVPIKYQLLDSLGNNVTNLSATTSIQAVANSQCSGTPDGAAVLLYSPTVGATGGSTFRSSSSGFIFNWDTTVVVPNGPGCYTLVVQLNDGSAPKATTVRLK
jgi:hypothetical protein